MAKKYINDVRFWLLAIVIFGGGFALHPSVGLSILDFSSLRVGLYQIVAVSLLLFSLPLLLKKTPRIVEKPMVNRRIFGNFYRHHRRNIFRRSIPAHRVIFIIAIILTHRRIIRWLNLRRIVKIRKT